MSRSRTPLVLVVSAGLAATVGQVVLVRELLVLFAGFEPALGAVFASWLFWTALGSSLAGRLNSGPGLGARSLPWLATLLALLLPASLLLVRAGRVLWSIPQGEFPTLQAILSLSLLTPAPFCLASGFFFVCAWAAVRQEAVSDSTARPLAPLGVFLGEAMGSALGGVLLSFVLLPLLPVLAGALAVSGLVLAATALPVFGPKGVPRPGLKAFWGLAAAAIVWAMAGQGALDRASHAWQWGRDLVAVADTPYQNLALTEREGQYTLFAGGAFAFSAPDREADEQAVHLAFLQHPGPRTALLVGGDVFGAAAEALRHNSLVRLDFVDPDPEAFAFLAGRLPQAMTAAARDRRVRVFHQDAYALLGQARDAYDVVLVALGDPINAQMNRFYTTEFFARVRQALTRDGVLSFAVSSSPEALGEVQARHLQTFQATLAAVFPEVAAYPGAQARFFAAKTPGLLTDDVLELARRIEARGLDLRYVREYYLLDTLEPMRLAQFRSVLSEGPARQNRDFEPACYFGSLALWALQIHAGLKDALLSLAAIPRTALWAAIILAALALTLLPGRGPRGRARAIRLAVGLMGAAEIAMEIVLLLAFQILRGNLYSRLAWIIAAYMAGLALGTAAAMAFAAQADRAGQRLVLVQSVFCLALAGLAPLLALLQSVQPGPGIHPLDVLFPILGLFFGGLGGLHFSLSATALAGASGPDARLGGGLYALDLVGAMAGSLASSLLLIPLFGLLSPLAACVALCAGSAAALGLALRAPGGAA